MFTNHLTEQMDKAKNWTELMAQKYTPEITSSIDNTIEYRGAFQPKEKHVTENIPNMQVDAIDSVSAIIKYYNPNKKMAILNFTSYLYPGGGFLGGSMAQEEALCHNSFLYNVLAAFADTYYKENSLIQNSKLYQNVAMINSKINFFANDDVNAINPYFCDVITCAAPNYSSAKCFGVTREKNSVVLKERIKFILDIANLHDYDTLILGAFGCGIFGQSAEEVASIFKELLQSGKYTFNDVIKLRRKSHTLACGMKVAFYLTYT